MLPRTEPMIYNEQAIKAWRLEIDFLPSRLQHELENQTQWEEHLKKIQSEFGLNGQRLKVAKERLQAHKDDLLTKHKIVLDDPQSIKKANKLFTSDPTLKQLQSDIQEIENKQTSYNNQITAFQKDILESQQTVLALRARKEFLNNQQIPAAENFLHELRSNPNKLFREKLSFLFQELDHFNKQVCDQDDNLRLCLHQLELKIKTLQAHKTTLEEPTVNRSNVFEDLHKLTQEWQSNNAFAKNILNSKRIWQLKFAQLNGFLWDLLLQYQYRNPDPNQDFIDLLQKHLADMHISESGDLPDEMATGESTFEQFQSVKVKHPQVFTMQPKVLPELNQNAYELALMRLQDYAKRGSDEKHIKAGELAEAIEADVKHHHKDEEKHLLHKKYCKTLTQAHQMYTALDTNNWDQKTDAIFDHFVKSANDVQGSRSTGKRVAGLILGVAGIILATTLGVACIGAAIATAGGTTLLSGFGFALSASLFVKSMALVAGVGSIGLIAGGFGLFHHGRQKGVSQKIAENATVIENHKVLRA